MTVTHGHLRAKIWQVTKGLRRSDGDSNQAFWKQSRKRDANLNSADGSQNTISLHIYS